MGWIIGSQNIMGSDYGSNSGIIHSALATVEWASIQVSRDFLAHSSEMMKFLRSLQLVGKIARFKAADEFFFFFHSSS